MLFTVRPFRAITPINSAEVISALGVAYDVYAGSLVDDAQQGVVIVAQSEIDPCAALSPRSEPALYKTPSRSGAVTLTQIVGDTVIFNTPDGGTGQFNYATGQFVALPAAH